MEKVQTMEHKPYKATKAFHPITGIYRWGVWCDTAKFMVWPTNYGYRSARKMANRLNREYKKAHGLKMKSIIKKDAGKKVIPIAAVKG